MAIMNVAQAHLTEEQEDLLICLWQDQAPGRFFPLTVDDLNRTDDNEPHVNQAQIDGFLQDIRDKYRCFSCGTADDVSEAGNCPSHGPGDD